MKLTLAPLAVAVPPWARNAAKVVAPAGTPRTHSTVTAGGLNLIIGFGADLWAQIAPAGGAAPELRPFDAVRGIDGHHAPATQHDIWIWVHGTGEDVALDAAAPSMTASAAAKSTTFLIPTPSLELPSGARA